MQDEESPEETVEVEEFGGRKEEIKSHRKL